MTRIKDVLKITESELLKLGYADEIDIVKGHVTIQIQIDNSNPTVVIMDRAIVKAVR